MITSNGRVSLGGAPGAGGDSRHPGALQTGGVLDQPPTDSALTEGVERACSSVRP
ncbi:hypothetical protein H7I76_22190 [Mycolicibacterium vaccae]|nr:hypothetical protein [Mycolicibacterium vaccae]